MLVCSGTRWLFWLFNIWPLSTMKFAQKHKRLTKVGLTFCQILNKLAKIAKDFWNFGKAAKLHPIWKVCSNQRHLVSLWLVSLDQDCRIVSRGFNKKGRSSSSNKLTSSSPSFNVPFDDDVFSVASSSSKFVAQNCSLKKFRGWNVKFWEMPRVQIQPGSITINFSQNLNSFFVKTENKRKRNI